jgi:hypothetical protein
MAQSPSVFPRRLPIIDLDGCALMIAALAFEPAARVLQGYISTQQLQNIPGIQPRRVPASLAENPQKTPGFCGIRDGDYLSKPSSCHENTLRTFSWGQSGRKFELKSLL